MDVQSAYSGPATGDGPGILGTIRSIHSRSPLCGEPENALLSISGDLLLYTISLLKGETAQCPALPTNEWYGFLSALKPHWIQPSVYWQITHQPPSSRPPGEIIDALRLAYLKNKARSMAVERQIGEISCAMGKAGLRFLVLKGPALARTIYPDAALRAGSDIDLLVLPDDVRRTRAILESIGYGCIKKQFDLSRSFYFDEGFLYKDASKAYLKVEVHWDINPLPSIRTIKVGDLFSRSVRAGSGDQAFETLSPVDHIINAAMHIGLKHKHDVRLSWIYDVSLLCKGLEPRDWGVLQERSVEYCARIALESSLSMAQCWTGLQIPGEYGDFAKWPAPTKKEMAILPLLRQRQSKAIDHIELILSGPAPIGEKMGIIFDMAFPPPPLMREQYKPRSDLLLPFYYVRRLLK